MSSPSLSIEIDKIMSHVRDFSFSPEISSNETFLDVIRQFLHQSYIEMSLLEIDKIDIKLCNRVASDFLGDDLTRIKKTDERRLAFEASFVMLYSVKPRHHQSTNSMLVRDFQTFLSLYPEFGTLDCSELSLLLSFRNVMKLAQQVIPPKHHKNQLLDIVTRITEGYRRRYVTGGGQTAATNRRVLIYQREGDVIVSQRIPKPADPLISCLNRLCEKKSAEKRLPVSIDSSRNMCAGGIVLPSYDLQEDMDENTSNQSSALAQAATMIENYSKSPLCCSPRESFFSTRSDELTFPSWPEHQISVIEIEEFLEPFLTLQMEGESEDETACNAESTQGGYVSFS